MNILALAAGKDHEHVLARAFLAGAAAHGNLGEIQDPLQAVDWTGFDAVMMVGVKSREYFDRAIAAGKGAIMLDKGYSRTRGPGEKICHYWRVSVNSHHPTRYLVGAPWSYDRLPTIDLQMQPWKESGTSILLAGSSGKFHAFNKLIEPTAYAADIVRQIREVSSRPIIYRPKPSWSAAVPIPGTTFSHPKEKLTAALSSAWCMVTHGSNACFEAVLSGTPCIIIGDAVAKPISSTGIAEIVAPRRATENQRIDWLAHLSYCQWTIEEMQRGEAWPHIGRHL